MKRWIALLLAATIAAPVASANKSAPPPALASSGPWVVHTEGDVCLLERNFPEGAVTNTLAFQPLLDLPEMELYVVTKPRSDQQYTGTFNAHIEPGAQTFTGHYYSVMVPKTKSRMTRLTIDRAALEQLKDGDTLRVQAKPIDLVFKIVRPDRARITLQSCVNELKKAWGIDPDADKQAVTQLAGNPAGYFGPGAYPREALSKGIYGRVIALLNIAPDGTVEHCRIVSSAGAALNDGTCKAAMRVRFKPPRDKEGKPLRSTYLLPVRWVLPGAPDS